MIVTVTSDELQDPITFPSLDYAKGWVKYHYIPSLTEKELGMIRFYGKFGVSYWKGADPYKTEWSYDYESFTPEQILKLKRSAETIRKRRFLVNGMEISYLDMGKAMNVRYPLADSNLRTMAKGKSYTFSNGFKIKRLS